MPVPIPTAVYVGKTRYDIVVQAVPRKGFGCIYFAQRVIQITPRPAAKMRLTFWHELTHAILHDMGHGLATNERFVEQFSERLHKAIESAEFTHG
jgi:Zn-dependent peptidase ImmA (M78 family)